jgi:gliding motility-associated-like protein
VRVLEDLNLFVPSAFTPNNDGLNDEFKPFVPGFEVEDYRFEVYDRWGKVLFQTRSLDTGWLGDGTPDGIYFWSIRGVNKLDGEKVKEQGWVMLKK